MFPSIAIVVAVAAVIGGVPLGSYRRFAWYEFDLVYDTIGATLASLWLALATGA